MKTTEENIDKKNSDYYISNPSVPISKSFLYPLQVGHFYYSPGYKLHRSSFDSFLLMFIMDGSCNVKYGSHSVQARKNNFVLLDCYEEHAYSSEKGWEAIWIHFDGHTARTLYEMITDKLGNVFSLDDPLTLINRMSKIYELYHRKEPIREMLMHKYLNDILVALTLYSPMYIKEVNQISVIETLLPYIHEHIQEELRIENLAKQAMMSNYYFIRVFKKHTGMSPHEYIVNYRLQCAKYLLIHTDMSIKDICFEIGFSSESVFCASFRKNIGISPAAYRKEQRHSE